MKILFIGGTGVISSACSELCIEKGIDLYLLNRRLSQRNAPEGARNLKVDINDQVTSKSSIEKFNFDAVVDWIAYKPEDVLRDYEIFKDKTSQYIFISSASVYQKPASFLPITENEPLYNPYWEYSQKKIDCENILKDLFESKKFPVTIVRPSHTYDKTKIPLHGGYTSINRILERKKVIIHDDGTSLWTLTHHKDFAKGFIGLLGKEESIGEAYHITSDEVLTWDEICETFGEKVKVEPDIVHIPSEFIREIDKEWGDGLLGDKAHSMVFDNRKIKEINPEYEAEIPFKEGAEEIIAWYFEDPSRKQIDMQKDNIMDEIISKYEETLK